MPPVPCEGRDASVQHADATSGAVSFVRESGAISTPQRAAFLFVAFLSAILKDAVPV